MTRTATKLIFAAGFACIANSGLAQAVTHEMTILRDGFFPKKLHIQPGDTVQFNNESGYWVWLYSADWNDACGWQSGWIANNNDWDILVQGCTELVVLAPRTWGDNYDSWTSNNQYRGEISFDDPDLGQ